MIFRAARRLRQAGVLGINGRNIDYVYARNDRRLYPLVNDKLRTKKLAETHGVAAPVVYGVIETPRQIGRLQRLTRPHPQFVIKPAQGAGGNGILVIDGEINGGYRRHDGVRLSLAAVKFHISNILSGMYSLGGHPDKAFLEEKVTFDPVFKDIAYLGVPDLRIAVYRGVPVMAMARLPTMASDGKANLHKSGVGLGIDLATGVTRHGVVDNRAIDTHPDTGASITGIGIPHWDEILQMSAKAYDMTGLGLLGVDLVLDEERGPLVLELNARPGLSIQIANRAGLRHRLDQVDAAEAGELPCHERIDFARDRFGAADQALA